MFVTALVGLALADDVQVTVKLADLLADRTPAVVGGGTLAGCSGPASNLANLQAHLNRAEGALPLLDLDTAIEALDVAGVALGCLDEAVAGSLAARVWFLRGLVAVLGKDLVTAQAHFQAALVLRPGLDWDETWAPDLRRPYDAARAAVAAQAPALVTILGSPGNGTLWLDGRPLELKPGAVEMRPGRHYLQLAGDPWRTWTLDLVAGAEATLIAPGDLGPQALAWAQDPDLQHRLNPLLTLVVEPGSELQVHGATRSYEVRPGKDNWKEVRPPRHTGRWVALGGGAVAAGAAMLGVLSWSEARGAVQGAESAEAWSDYVEARVGYEQAEARYRQAWIAEGVGLAVLGVGLAVEWRFGGRP